MIEMRHPSEQGSVNPHAAGSPDAFGEVYRSFHPRLLRFCRRHCWDAAAAEDAVQETFVRALRYFGSYDPSYPLWPWLKTIARNVISGAAEAPLGGSAAPPVLRDPMTRVDDRDELEKALGTLNVRHQQAIRLRYLSDLSPKESALQMGLSVAAFNQILFRARDRLRQEYVRLSETALGLVMLPAAMLRRLWRWAAERARPNRPGVLEGVQGALPAVAHITAGTVALMLILGGGPGVKPSEIPRNPVNAPVDGPLVVAPLGDSPSQEEPRQDRRMIILGVSGAEGSEDSVPGAGPTSGEAGADVNGPGGHGEETLPTSSTQPPGADAGTVEAENSGPPAGGAEAPTDPGPGPGDGGSGRNLPPVPADPPLEPPTQVDDPGPGPTPRCTPTCVAIGPVVEELPDLSGPPPGDPVHSLPPELL
jgi:RNA polymerase sigma-70 factor (ECF subfamily)